MGVGIRSSMRMERLGIRSRGKVRRLIRNLEWDLVWRWGWVRMGGCWGEHCWRPVWVVIIMVGAMVVIAGMMGEGTEGMIEGKMVEMTAEVMVRTMAEETLEKGITEVVMAAGTVVAEGIRSFSVGIPSYAVFFIGHC